MADTGFVHVRAEALDYCCVFFSQGLACHYYYNYYYHLRRRPLLVTSPGQKRGLASSFNFSMYGLKFGTSEARAAVVDTYFRLAPVADFA